LAYRWDVQQAANAIDQFIIGFRNILIQGYATIDHSRVWHIAQTSLPGLRREVSVLLAELGEAGP
jgi:uncharacterized protein with HEPN domain